MESVADAAASASVTPDRAISGADTEQRAACAAQASESESSSVEAASVTPNRAISGADTERRAACAAQGSESERSSVDRKCCRRSCGGERHTRHGDQRRTCRAARGLCSSSFREREQQR
jgi:hypothetical protein